MSTEDPLAEEPFAFRETKNGLVQISCLGKVVTTLAGKEASRFLTRALNPDPHQLQLLMAKATGHFKQGNERVGKDRGKK